MARLLLCIALCNCAIAGADVLLAGRTGYTYDAEKRLMMYGESEKTFGLSLGA
jgi:hypothetical protein